MEKFEAECSDALETMKKARTNQELEAPRAAAVEFYDHLTGGHVGIINEALYDRSQGLTFDGWLWRFV